MSKTLYLMRHGQTLFNVRRKKQGWCDSPLTSLGIQQAQNAKTYFEEQDIHFDHAYSSTSERACDTLELITDLPYTRVKGLKEWNFGSFEGESEDLNPPLPYGDFFVTYGGEEEMAFRERFCKTILQIMQKDDHKDVLIVAHGAALAQFMRNWQHTTSIVQKGRNGNCCILKYEFQEETFKLLEIVNPNID